MNYRLHRLGMAYLFAALLPAPALAADPPCATPEQAKAVTEFYSNKSAMLPLLASRLLKLREAVVVSALPKGKSVGAPGSRFREVWDSARAWGQVVFFVPKGGHMIEVHGELPSGEPSKQSNYFNLGTPAAGVSGHLRPDLVGAIYGISLSEGKAEIAGVVFYDAAGDQVFAILLPGEGAIPTPAAKAAFQKTFDLITWGPGVCR